MGRSTAACLLFRQADTGDLRAGEHGVRGDGAIEGADVVGVHDVVPHNPGFGVRHVLELEVVHGVTQGPDPGYRGAIGVVGHDVAVLV
ncbi:hypothetical protein [Streptomyces sp. NPDC002265]|uniref:hypothetical protein n=1 Tax=Streptomyces sp. NPDC002265 TaxID=3154415 RepID=UPI00331CDD2E